MKALLRAAKGRRELKWLAPLATRAPGLGRGRRATRLLRWAGGGSGGVGEKHRNRGLFLANGQWSPSREGIE